MNPFTKSAEQSMNVVALKFPIVSKNLLIDDRFAENKIPSLRAFPDDIFEV